MAKPMKLPKYLQGKNPKLLIEVFEDYKPMDPLNLNKGKMIKSICFECPICGIQMWADANQGDRLQQMEDEHIDTCGEEGEIDASEVED